MKKTIKKCPRVLAIVVVSLISFVPFYYTLTMSTHSTDEIMLGVSAIPGKYLLTNISTALNDTFWVAFKNSLIVSLLSMTGSVLISLMSDDEHNRFTRSKRNALTLELSKYRDSAAATGDHKDLRLSFGRLHFQAAKGCVIASRRHPVKVTDILIGKDLLWNAAALNSVSVNADHQI